MRDYDQERLERHKERERLLGDRQFKLGGETFTYKANPSYDTLRRMTEPTALSGAEYISAVEAACLELIEDTGDAHKRFLSLANRAEDPVTMEDLEKVFTGLVQDAFRRPTEASSDSSSGDAISEVSSTEKPSSEQVVVSAA